MHNQLIIYTEQLKNGRKECIKLTVDPSFLDVHEKEVSFETPVHIEGEAYVTEDHLVLQLSCSTRVKLLCTICNDPLFFPLHISKIYYTLDLNQLPSAIFDYSSLIREELLLLIPPFAECNCGQCPERKSISSLLKNKKATDPMHSPFSNL